MPVYGNVFVTALLFVCVLCIVIVWLRKP